MKRVLLLMTATMAVLLLTFGCVAHKKKGSQEVGWFKKGYHNLTTHYNYWFNADELMKLSTDRLEKSHQDNYNHLLPLYAYKAEDPQSIKPDMDKVIKKSATAIALHRVGEWTDDCYFLIAQAQYMKQDYESAEASFAFIQEEYNPNKPSFYSKGKKSDLKKKKKKSNSNKKKKRKKKKKKSKKKKSKRKKKKAKAKKDKEDKAKADGKSATTDDKKETKKPKPSAVPKGQNPYSDGLTKRDAAYPEAMVWYARALTDREKHEESHYLIQALRADPFFPNRLRDDLALAEAYNLLQQKKYSAAIKPLEEAVALTSKKNGRARLAFILAQLYAKGGDPSNSYQALATVLKSRPSFTMEFNARLMQVRSAWENGTLASDDAEKSLGRLLKEDKYIEFKDQIYFTLGSIAIKDKRNNDAIAALQNSLLFNVNNQAQKAESYLALGDLFFETENFVQAKNYFDSTLVVLNKEDTRYERVDKYAKNLTDIARLITTINHNDSLVRVAGMSAEERRDLAKAIKKEEQAKLDLAAAKADGAADQPTPGFNAGFLGAGIQPSSFYFYNETFVKKGKREFDRIWGDRKLEDNWRRKDKLSSVNFDDPAATKTDSSGAALITDAEIEDIFRGIPSTPEELGVLNRSTYESLFQLGTLFREKLENNFQAATRHEEELSRFPDSLLYQKETWYYLYLEHRDMGNKAQSQTYYDLLVGKYPNSSHARSLSDENFLNAGKEKERKLNDFYKAAFEDFQAGQYDVAYKSCQSAPGLFGGTNPLMPKFALLGALCTGSVEGEDEYCAALKKVIASYPDSEEAVRAREISRLLACDGFKDARSSDPNMPAGGAETFSLADDKIHYFLLVLHGADIPIADVKGAIANYNRQYHQMEGLRLSNIYLGTDTSTPIMVIRKFDKKSDAMKYYQEIFNKDEFLGHAPTDWGAEYYPITQDNYRKVLKNRSLDGYLNFFNDNYLK